MRWRNGQYKTMDLLVRPFSTARSCVLVCCTRHVCDRKVQGPGDTGRMSVQAVLRTGSCGRADDS